MRIDFQRLNHVLIPKTKEDRDRFRASRFGRMVMPIGRLFGLLTDEGRTLLIVTLVAGAFSVDVRRTTAYIFFSAMFGLIVGSLATAVRLRLVGVELEVLAPRRVTKGELVTFSVVCRRRGGTAPTPPVRVRGPFLPWDGTWVERANHELVIAPNASARTTLVARFVARGIHHLDSFSAAAVAPLGISCGPNIESGATKVHVVPRIARVERLPLTIVARHQPGGVALASKRGESMDLLGVRPYRPGDPMRDLHARSWARTGVPVVREYQQEYFTRVGVVLDTDTADLDQLEAAIELAAGVIAKLSRGEALVDVLVVGERVHELTLGRSLGTLDQALDLLSTVERGKKLEAAAMIARIRPYLERLSSVVLVTVAEDAEREALVQAIEDSGIRCARLAVDETLMKSIQAGDPLGW